MEKIFQVKYFFIIGLKKNPMFSHIFPRLSIFACNNLSSVFSQSFLTICFSLNIDMNVKLNSYSKYNRNAFFKRPQIDQSLTEKNTQS